VKSTSRADALARGLPENKVTLWEQGRVTSPPFCLTCPRCIVWIPNDLLLCAALEFKAFCLDQRSMHA
jgi:hypothetical protein